MNRVLFSSVSDHWSTPRSLYEELNKEFHFTFDPCPLNSSQDGTKLNWRGRAFCNPPYSKIAEFIRKGLWHVSKGDVEIAVFLLPARTDTAWFHDYILGKAEIRFLRGRLRFGDAINSAPFPSMIAIFTECKIEQMQDEAGGLFA